MRVLTSLFIAKCVAPSRRALARAIQSPSMGRGLPRFSAGLEDVAVGPPNPLTREQVDGLIQQVSFPIIRHSVAPALQGSVVVRAQFGLASCRMLAPAVSKDNRRSPHLARCLCAYLRNAAPHATVSSLTVAFHRRAPLHIDDMNIGPSWATALGCTSGGNLWVATTGLECGTVLPTASRLCEFFASLAHQPLAFSGPRYYISFYTHRAVSRISEDVRAELLRLGVPLPSAELVAQQNQQVQQLPRLQERHRVGAVAWHAHIEKQFYEGAAKDAGHFAENGSWVCRGCRTFDIMKGGRPRMFCSQRCKERIRRESDFKAQPQRHAKKCKCCSKMLHRSSKQVGRGLEYCPRHRKTP
jgi:hypothetical protein